MIRVKINTADITKELRKKIEKEASLGLAVTSLKILEDLKEATPVDTGHARDSWSIEPTSNPTKITITNDADYIGDLNNGSSQQAPRFFIETTLLKYARAKGRLVTFQNE